MSAQEQARALMLRHHHWIKNRQRSLLCRANHEVGLPGDASYWTSIQGKPLNDAARSYDRSGSALS